MAKYYKKNQPTALELVILGIGKALWWLLTLPFKKRRKFGLSGEDKSYIIKKRLEIEQLLKSNSIIELKHAVLEADKLVDFILKKKGYRGEAFANRLRAAEKYIEPDVYDRIWQGHKIRNQIVHDSGNIDRNILISAVKKLLSYLYYE